MAKLRRAGAIILAKANLDEYAGGTHRSSYGGQTCNPYATDRDSGSSSTGSAAGPSANLAVCGISEESLGSIREPGKKCGLVAIAPTRGLVSRHGIRDRLGLRVCARSAHATARLRPVARRTVSLSCRRQHQPKILLLRGEADLAVRVSSLRHASLRARRVARLKIGLFAAPSYIERRGRPATPSSLRGHDVILPAAELARLPEAARLASRPEVRVAFRSNSLPALLSAAAAGLGIVPVAAGWGDMDRRLLRLQLLDDVPSRTIWLVTPPNVDTRPAIRSGAAMPRLVPPCPPTAFRRQAETPPAPFCRRSSYLRTMRLLWHRCHRTCLASARIFDRSPAIAWVIHAFAERSKFPASAR